MQKATLEIPIEPIDNYLCSPNCKLSYLYIWKLTVRQQMGASGGNMHINFRFHVSCRWKQAYCLRLKSPSCIDFSEWNMTGSYSQTLSCRRTKLLCLFSWEKGHRGEELLMELGGKKKGFQAWAAMDLNEEAGQQKSICSICSNTEIILENPVHPWFGRLTERESSLDSWYRWFTLGWTQLTFSVL